MLMLRSSLEVLVLPDTTELLPPLPLPPQLWPLPLPPSCTTPSSALPTCPTQCMPWHTLSLARSTRATLVSAPTTSASRSPASRHCWQRLYCVKDSLVQCSNLFTRC